MKKEEYNPKEIEEKWQKKWEEEKIYQPNLDLPGKAGSVKPFYNLMMFPYPSAEGLHVGNVYAFTGADVYGRFKRMQGNCVFEPIGLDGFGIHSENYALKIGKHPKEQAKTSEVNFYRQLSSIGNGFDWSRRLETYDSNYYKWTQWIFVQLFKRGLAYRKKAPVNFCPSCKTVLSDEQVIKKVKSQKSKVKTSIQNSKVINDDQQVNQRESNHEEGEATINICERCSTQVEIRDLEQWFFKITAYAERLLSNIPKLNWTEKVKTAQREWIGRSEGAQIEFKIQNSKFKIDVYTTRVDTLYGATFLVLAPEHELVDVILGSEATPESVRLAQDKSGSWTSQDDRENVRKYVQEAKRKTEIERGAENKEKTGVFTGLYAINPLNNKEVPVWIADYALMSYGTGAIMAVPAHDERDFEFAKKYNLSIRTVVIPTKKSSCKEDLVSHASSLNGRIDTLKKNISDTEENVNSMDSPGVEPGRLGVSIQPSEPAEPMQLSAYIEPGILVNSGKYNGLLSDKAREKITQDLEKSGVGKKKVVYHLRDWLISRQRYWGAPIPMIYCEKCGWQTVPENQLPVLLPDVQDWRPEGTGVSPLANHPEFYKTTCPNCKGEARRETDVIDTFLDSAWYFFRYISTEFDTKAFDADRAKKWLPVTMYIGGAEHSVLHLLYSRFITMVFKDMGLISFEEPYHRFYAHGLIIKDGAKMSKSKGNVVNPDEYLAKYGADTLRCYLRFVGPFDMGGDFRDSGIEGMHRFLKRVWNLIADNVARGPVSRFPSTPATPRSEVLLMMHKIVKGVTEDMENLRFNTAIAKLMTWYNYLSEQKEISREELITFVKLLAPFAPFIAEELWQNVILVSEAHPESKNGRSWTSQDDETFQSIHVSGWPKYDEKYLENEESIIAVQINGKTRDTIIIQNSALRHSSGQKFSPREGAGRIQNVVEEMAKEREKIKKHLDGKEVKKVIYIPGKVINFVTN